MGKEHTMHIANKAQYNKVGGESNWELIKQIQVTYGDVLVKVRQICDHQGRKYHGVGGCATCPFRCVNCGHGADDLIFDFEKCREILNAYND